MAERACEPHSVREKMRGFSSFRMKDVCGTLCILFSFRLDSATTFLCSPRQLSAEYRLPRYDIASFQAPIARGKL